MVRMLASSGVNVAVPRNVSWSDPETARQQLSVQIESFLAGTEGRPWTVHWCAGKATVRSTSEVAEVEKQLLDFVLQNFESHESQSNLADGTIMFTSSAGGVYAGSQDPPFDEGAEPIPNSPYGFAKLEMERRLIEWCSRHGTRLLIARVSSVYGSQQDIGKAQGLLSHVLRAALLRQPLTLFVPFSTTRNYVAADDAAALILRHVDEDWSGARVANICAPYNVSVATLLRATELVTRKRVLIRQVISDASRHESLDLRVTTRFTKLLPQEVRTPLHVGIHKLMSHAIRTLQTPETR
jgi:UDP-glucose 4-epimerase